MQNAKSLGNRILKNTPGYFFISVSYLVFKVSIIFNELNWIKFYQIKYQLKLIVEAFFLPWELHN